MRIRPNILIVIQDDVCPYDAWALSGATAPAILPNLDMVMRTGRVFPRFYTMPACSSTRASLLTGKYPAQTGVGKAILENDPFIMGDHPSLLRKLREQGYTNKVFGKWHLTGAGAPNELTDAENRGAHEFIGTVNNLGPTGYWNWEKVVHGAIENEPTYSTEFLFHLAIDAALTTPEPWCIWLAPHAGHEPYHTPPAGTYVTQSAGTVERTQWIQSLESMDYYLGQLLAVLPKNTVLCTFGDNGSPVAVTCSPPGERKGTVGEGGVRNTLTVWRKSNRPDPATDGLPVDIVMLHHWIASLAWVVRMPCLDLFTTIAFSQKHDPNGFGPSFTERERMACNQRYKLIVKENPPLPPAETLHDLSTAQTWQDGPAIPESNWKDAERTAYLQLKQAIEARS